MKKMDAPIKSEHDELSIRYGSRRLPSSAGRRGDSLRSVCAFWIHGFEFEILDFEFV